MTHSATSRIKPIPWLSQTTFILSLSLIVSFAAACGVAKQNSGSGASTASSASSSSAIKGVTSFEGMVTARMFGEKQPMEFRYAIKGNRTRFEAMISPDASKRAVMLMDMSSGTQTTLIPQSKMYMTVNWGELAEEMTQNAGKGSSGNFPKVTSTGKTETVAGLNCEHWILGDKQDMDMCLAKGMGYFGFGGQSGGILDKLKNLALREKIKAQLDANPEFAKFVEGGAFPLKMSHVENGQSKTIMEVTGIERKSLDDSLFTVPADYKKMEVPGIGGLSAGKK
ncbi:MAG TPA: DUF4412 domain-containing protein [Blastocatellia bacterium]|nr:DUF4412 domain-containing protein [Blastocatellia bacterium]